ncbi:MAG: hypothetical protein U9O94_02715 [Nanoarchaeota archaeon]|nr:hypothetical protein [Nanoarchaeota archaeon]
MASHEHFRFKIFNKTQHILQHSLADMPYENESLPPDVNNIATALDYITAVLNPNTKPAVDLVADLPAAGNSINDYRIVNDDGDGKAAGYMWLQYDGDATPEWKKVADMDWGVDSVLSGLLDQTQFLYPRKYGNTDYDPDTELPLTGVDAGQHMFGGSLANENLTLHANNGDVTGRTGYIQVDDPLRPTENEVLDIGTAALKFNDAYIKRIFIGTGTCTIESDGTRTIISDNHNDLRFAANNLLTTGNITGAVLKGSGITVDDLTDILTLTGSSITSNKGSIDFGDENLSTTGIINSTSALFGSDLALGVGSITSVSGSIDFGDEDLTTTGSLGVGSFSSDFLQIDDVKIDANKVYTDAVATDLELEATAGQVIKLNSNISGISGTFTTDLTAARLLTSKLTLDENKLYSTDLIEINAPIVPLLDNNTDIGTALKTIGSLFIKNSVQNGSETFSIAELMKYRSGAYRDAGQVTGVSDNDILRWDSASSKFLGSDITTLFAHGDISGITTDDAGHTQFTMLNGRVGGQIVHGGTAATHTLLLRSRIGASEGLNVKDGAITPANDKLLNVGEAALRFNNFYLWGEMIGARTENKLTTDLAAMASADKIGRLVYTTDDKKLNVDIGGSFQKIGHNTYSAIKTNVELGSAIDVSGSISDAREAIWQLCDSTELVLAVEITKTQTHVTINTDIDLTAGNYRLIGIQL